MMNETRDALGNVLCCHGRPFRCAECGEDYAAELNRPRQPVIELPDKHPLRIRAEKAERERGQLRAALVGLVGVDGRTELEQIEAVMRLMPAPAQDKAATIDAIHALLATMDEPQAADAVDPSVTKQESGPRS